MGSRLGYIRTVREFSKSMKLILTDQKIRRAGKSCLSGISLCYSFPLGPLMDPDMRPGRYSFPIWTMRFIVLLKTLV